jgi:hypothetical protein
MAGRHRGVAALRKILFAGRQTWGPAPTAPLLTIELVDSRTEVAHRVADEAFAASRRDRGCYTGRVRRARASCEPHSPSARPLPRVRAGHRTHSEQGAHPWSLTART